MSEDLRVAFGKLFLAGLHNSAAQTLPTGQTFLPQHSVCSCWERLSSRLRCRHVQWGEASRAPAEGWPSPSSVLRGHRDRCLSRLQPVGEAGVREGSEAGGGLRGDPYSAHLNLKIKGGKAG